MSPRFKSSEALHRSLLTLDKLLLTSWDFSFLFYKMNLSCSSTLFKNYGTYFQIKFYIKTVYKKCKRLVIR